MANIVVLFVTRTGHSRALAQAVASRLGVTAQEIVDIVSRNGFFCYMRAGAHASMNKATPIWDPNVDLSEAASVVLVQPTWAGAVCPPLRTWLNAHKAEFAGKKLALLVTNKGSEGETIKADFEAEFGPLAAFTCIHEKDPQPEKDAAVKAFCEAAIH
jgi:flavodoxin